MEAEIENLSWKIERAETTDRGEIENQMDIAEKKRLVLLKDFFPTDKWKYFFSLLLFEAEKKKWNNNYSLVHKE